MRFYNLPQWVSVTAPPNVVIDNLASTGIIGSLAFVFLVWVTVRTMYRLPYALGTLGLVVLIGHYVDGLFDIFWIGGPTVAPYIICGVSLGLADIDRMARDGTAAGLAPPATRGTAARRAASAGVLRARAAGASMRTAFARGPGDATPTTPAP
jgi:type IV secretory pathway TrbL component